MMPSGYRWDLAIALLVALGGLRPPILEASTGPQPTEFELKAQFVERFATFVRWPDLEVENEEEPAAIVRPFSFCVVGETPLARTLPRTLSERQVQGRDTEVLKLPTSRLLGNSEAEPSEDIGVCDLLFLGKLDDDELNSVLEAIHSRPILTVSDRAGRAEAGVMLNLFIADGRIGFEANEGAASAVGLELTSQLLRLARRVGEEGRM